MFYDLDDNIKDNFRFLIESGEIKSMSLKIDCVSGKTWFCSLSSDLTIEARHLGDTSWINLETTGIDLSPWDGNREIFEIRFTAGIRTTYNLDSFYFYLA